MSKEAFNYKELFKFIAKCSIVFVPLALAIILSGFCPRTGHHLFGLADTPICDLLFVMALLSFYISNGFIPFILGLFAATHKAFRSLGIIRMLLIAFLISFLFELILSGGIIRLLFYLESGIGLEQLLFLPAGFFLGIFLRCLGYLWHKRVNTHAHNATKS